MKKGFKEFSKGIIRENPIFALVLGMCPTLAVTTSAENGVGMGIAATVVLLGSNIVISLLRKVIPDKVRIPAYITVIAGFVTIIQLVLKAYFTELDQALGIFIPLIVVNCIILARAEMYASKNNVGYSILDALGMGFGFTAALVLIGGIREILGSGTIFGIDVSFGVIPQATLFILPAGGFLILGLLMAAYNKFTKGKEKVADCESCPIQCFNAEQGEQS
ncbi:MAG: electron transport complex subunit E [Clostridiales bacterium]|nr:electron transport complex subunit E [Clostridiales bacterium]